MYSWRSTEQTNPAPDVLENHNDTRKVRGDIMQLSKEREDHLLPLRQLDEEASCHGQNPLRGNRSLSLSL